MFKDLAEDSLMKELGLANTIDTKAAAVEELFRVKLLAAYQTHRTALDEEHNTTKPLQQSRWRIRKMKSLF